jgi:hypothetical protein
MNNHNHMEVTMKQSVNTMFAAVVTMALAVSGAHADTFERISSVGDAGELHECAGVFLPVHDAGGRPTSETVFLLHGGYRSELDAEPVPDLWVLADGYWQRVASDAPAIADHSLVAAGGRGYAIGGVGEDDWLRPLDRITIFEIRRIDGRLEAMVEEIQVPGAAPQASFGASAVAIDRGRSIAYVGGDLLDNPLSSDPSQLWEYRLEENRWIRLADLPTDISHHTAVSARDFVWVFGGEDSDGLSDALYRYDVLANGWSRIDIQGDSPEPRKEHRAVVAGSNMLVFGGIETPFFPETLDSVWQLDLDTLTWTEKTSMNQGLASMTAAVVPRSMTEGSMIQVMIYGGVLDAWSFPLDLSDATTMYTSDISARLRAVRMEPVTGWVD